MPIRAAAYRVYAPLFDADGDPVGGAAGLDSEVSLDGGAFADCTNEWTEIGTSGVGYLDLTGAELTADCVVGRIQTSTTGAKTTVFVLYPQDVGDLKVDVQSYGGTALTASGGRPEVNVSHWGGTAIATAVILAAANIGTGALTAAKFAAGAFDAVWTVTVRLLTAGTNIVLAKGTGLTGLNDLSGADVGTAVSGLGLATAAAQTTIAGYIDTEVAAIKAKTDALPASPASSTDAPSAASVAAAVRTELTTELSRVDVATSTRLATAGYAASPSAASVASAVRTELTTELGRVDIAISSRLATAGYTVPVSLAALVNGVWDALASAHTVSGSFGSFLDASVSGVSTGGVSAGDIADAVRTELALELGRIDAAVSSRASTGAAMTLTVGERGALALALLLLPDGIETGYSLQAAQRIQLAVLAGRSDGFPDTPAHFRDLANTKNRITVTADPDGNRTLVTLDAS